MSASEPPPRDVSTSLMNDAAATPLIVNGLTVRLREPVDGWLWVVCLMPDIMALFVLIAIGMRRLLRYLDSKRL